MKKEIHIAIDRPEEIVGAESFRQMLHAKFGHNTVRIASYDDFSPSVDTSTVRIQGGNIPDGVDELHHFAADIVTSHLRMEPTDLTSRVDASILDRYRANDGSLEMSVDPRLWIYSNPFIERLGHDNSYKNLIDYVTEEKGLFLKPALYPNQRNYWNSVTNAGLPVTKKRDPIHEGTFMLHDLYHFALQDPLPVSLDNSVGSEDIRKVYLMHRMASEATTLVMADMIAVKDADLESMGYDIRRRRIFPVYQEILEYNPSVGQKALIDANLDFCFTGDVAKFRSLGATDESLEGYRNKYEVFFSADFVWNDNNLAYCTSEYGGSPEYRHYAETVHRLFGIPTIDTLYPSLRGTTIEVISDSFNNQLVQAQTFQSNRSELDRFKTATSKYLAGQLLIFYKHFVPELIEKYIGISEKFVGSQDVTTANGLLDEMKTMVGDYLLELRKNGSISSQDHLLNLMHVPFYPAQFIHYDRDADGYRNLSQNISDLKI